MRSQERRFNVSDSHNVFTQYPTDLVVLIQAQMYFMYTCVQCTGKKVNHCTGIYWT